jgi:hypothetical protein
MEQSLLQRQDKLAQATCMYYMLTVVEDEGQVMDKVVVLSDPARLTVCRNPFHAPLTDRIYPWHDDPNTCQPV